MNIGVLAKASIDPNMVRADSEGNILLESMPLALSEYDKNALEEALRIKQEKGGKVIVLSALTWGPTSKRLREAEQVMREALAMGADEAHLIVDEALIPGNPLTTSLALKALVEKIGGIDLILTGEGSMDTVSYQVASRMAALLGYPVATFARRLELLDGRVRVTRDLETRLETVELPLPAVISVTGEINKPRLPTLLQIRRAMSKPLNKYTLADLGATVEQAHVEVKEMKLLRVARKQVLIEESDPEKAADKLIEILENEGILK